MPATSHEPWHDWLLLRRAHGVGIRRFHQLLTRFGDASAVLQAAQQNKLADLLPAKVVSALKQVHTASIAPDLAWLQADDNHHLLTLNDPRYPERLRQTEQAPPLLFVHGDPNALHQQQLAIVGSRNPTPAGRSHAGEFAADLSSQGLLINSGMATGVDGAAHTGALDSGAQTVAVCATGLDRIYPAQHRELAHRIVQQGCLVSEFPIGTPASAHHFPQRNRIISGLSQGVLVVEAGLRSGSLITARYALEQGREVFAIPGSIHNPLSKGCHALIRDGAKLVETSRDILEELPALNTQVLDKPPVRRVQNPADSLSADQEAQTLLAQLGHDPVSMDQLIQRCQMPAEHIASLLTRLELNGLIQSQTGRYSRC